MRSDFSGDITKEINNLEDLEIDGIIILKNIKEIKWDGVDYIYRPEARAVGLHKILRIVD